MYNIISIVLRIFLILFILSSSVVSAASLPNVVVNSPSENFIGENFCFNSSFSNTSTDIGYGPYYALRLPPDLTFQSATFSGLSLGLVSNQTYSASATLLDPISGTNIIGEEDGSLVTLTLPVGSVSSTQPSLNVEICVAVDINAIPDVLQNNAVTIIPGFQFGDSATGLIGTDTIVGSAVENDFTPKVIKYSIVDGRAEGEHPPGPAWTYPITAIADIAATASVAPITFPTITLPGNVKFTGLPTFIGGVGCTITPDAATLEALTGLGNDISIDISCTSGTGSNGNSQDIKVDFDVYIIDTLDNMTCASTNAINTAKHLTLRKSASAANNPGEVITYTYTYQTSEFIPGISAFTVDDNLGDGVSYSDIGSNQVRLTINHGATTTTLDVPFVDIGTSSSFTNADINSAIIAAGGTIGPAQNGTISYTATIDQIYENGEPILTRDVITNNVNVKYSITGAGNATNCSESSSASVSIEDIGLGKVSIGSTTIKPGGVLQFRLTMNIPSGDANNVVLKDFLPLPVFTATDFPAFSGNLDTYPGSASAGNYLEYAPGSAEPGNVTVTRDAASNSVLLNFGDITSTGTQNIIIDLYAKASDEPFADGLNLANLLNVTTDNTSVDSSVGNAVAQILVRAPDVTIEKEITNAVNDLDAKDTIDYKVTIENKGGADAFDVTIKDVIAGNLNDTSCTVPVITGGSGSYTGSFSSADSWTIQLDNLPSGLLAGTLATLTYSCNINADIPVNTLVSNTAELSFSAGPGASPFPLQESLIEVSTIQASIIKSLVSTSESNTGFSSSRTEMAVGEIARFRLAVKLPQGLHNNIQIKDLIPSQLLYQNDGTTKIAFVGTSITSTGFPNPGGCTYTTINENIVPDCTITATGSSFSSGTDAAFNLGDISNNDDDIDNEFIILELNAILNLTSISGINVNNQATYTGASKSNKVLLKRVDPVLTLDKQVSDTSGDAGDPFTYTLTITAPSSSPSTAFDVTLVDILPPTLEYVTSSASLNTCSGVSSLNDTDPSGTGLSLTIDELSANESCTFTYDVRFSSAATPGEVVVNTATLNWTSLDGAGSNLSGTIPGAEKTYEATDSATVTVNITAAVKSIISTNKTHTSESGTGALNAERLLSIGEEIKYRLVVTVPEGTANNFMVRDNLPNELEYINNSAVVALVSDGSLLSSLGGALCSGGTIARLDPENAVTPDCAITPTLGSSGNSVDFNFANVTNTDGDTDVESIVIEFRALVKNHLSNQQATNVSNTFEVLLASNVNSSSNAMLGKIVEPQLTLTSQSTPNSVDNRINTTPSVAWVLTLTNTGLAQAFQIQDGDAGDWTIQLPVGVENITALNVVSTGTVVDNTSLATAINSTHFSISGVDNNILTIDREFSMSSASILTISFNTNLQSSVTPGSTLTLDNDIGYFGQQTGASAEDVRNFSDISTGTGNSPVTSASAPLNNYRTQTAVVVNTVASTPVIGVAKELVSNTFDPINGTFDLLYRLYVENSGDVALTNIQLNDDLSTTFSPITAGNINVTLVSSTDFTTTNGTFDGFSNQALIDNTTPSTLAIGETKTLDIALTVTPETNLGTYNNSVTASGISVRDSSKTPSDDSVNGNDPDSANDGPDNDTSVTPTIFAVDPQLGIAKAVNGLIVNNADGTYTFNYRIVAKNTGGVQLSNVQIVDDLGIVFSSADSFTVSIPTSSDFTVNSSYDGDVDKDLLASGQVLVVGESGTIDFQVIVTPGNTLGPYNNSATASATSPNGDVNDTSDDGSNPETDNGSGGFDDVTPITFAEEAEIGVAKVISAGPTNNGDGTHTLTYTMVVKNTGKINLTNVQIVDDLTTAFNGATFSVDAKSTLGSILAVNVNFDGDTDKNLLAASQSLVVGASETINLTVIVTPGSNLGAYSNSATANGLSPSGANISDSSDNGSDPETDNGSGGLDDATPVTFSENAEIAVAKAVSAVPTNNGDGTYSLTYTMVVKNTGEVNLSDVQVEDDLTTTFTGATFSIDAKSTLGSTLAVNANFDGNTDKNLLAASQSLVVGASETINLTVIVTPGTALGPYNNSAKASGISPSGETAEDSSDNGSDPETNNGSGGLDDATPVTFSENAEISVAKEVSAVPTNNGDGTYSLTYSMVVKNTGDISLTGVQVVDDLTTTFTGATFNVDAKSTLGSTLAVNAGFDGDTDKNLLAASQSLAVGASETINLTVIVTPGTALGPYNNSAKASGISPSGDTAEDSSDNGSDPETNNGSGGLDDATPVTFDEEADIGVAKAISSGPTNNGDGTHTLTYTIVVKNTGKINLTNVQVEDDLTTTFTGATFSVDAKTALGATLAVNASFDGNTDKSLLAASQSLAVGASETINLTVIVTPGAALGPYNNSAKASGISPSGDTVEDSSDNGSDSETDNGSGGVDDVTPVTFNEAASIGTAKLVSNGPINNNDGTYTLTYAIVLKNTGDSELTDVQLTDDLVTTFNGASFSVDAKSITGTKLTINNSFNGDSDKNLLAANQNLLIGESDTAVITITVTPGTNLGPYYNVANATGTSIVGTVVNDASDAGNNTETDNGSGGFNDPTPVSFTETPAIGIAKSISSAVVNNNDGTYTLTYAMVVRNNGDIDLHTIQILEDFAATYPAPATALVENLQSVDFTINNGFDGYSDQGLLAADQVLATGASGSLSLTIKITPDTFLGPYNNTAKVNGTSQSGTVIGDDSDKGIDPNSDNGDGGNNDTTPVTFTEAPAIAVAKEISGAVLNNEDGSYSVLYSIVVQNIGDVLLSNVQIVEDLSTTFAGATFTVGTITSNDVSVNTSFDGDTDTDLLSNNQNLAINTSAKILVPVTITPGAKLGPYNNTAIATGASPGGTNVTDNSDNGNDPTSDHGDGGFDDTTPMTFTEAPAIGIAKMLVANPINNSDGSYTLTYQLMVENTGDIALSNVQVDENLRNTFPAPSTFIVNSLSATSLAINSSFDGEANTNLLAANQNLAVDDTDTVILQLTVTPHSNLGPFNNTAVASGASPGGADVKDNSDNGNNSSGNNGIGTDEDSTPVTFTEAPGIAIAKTIGNLTNNGDGTYRLTFDFNLKNIGDIRLNDVQVVDDLLSTFNNLNIYTISSLSSTSLSVNGNFDGKLEQGLLAANQSLAAGGSDVITLVLEVTPAGDLGPYNNSAEALGMSPGGGSVMDTSDNGTDPESNNGAGGLDDVTPVLFTEAPAIGIAKVLVAEPTNNSDGTYSLSYQLKVENIGDVSLSNVQVVEDLRTTFPAPAIFVINSISATSLTVNGNFDGDTDTNVFADSQSLAVGATDTITLELTLTPGANLGPYNNTAVASGTSPGGADTSDESDNGSNTSGDNGEGTDNDATPVTFTEAPAIGIAKALVAEPTNNSDGTYSLSYQLKVENIGDVSLSNVQVVEDLRTTFPAPAIFVINSISATSLTVNGNFDGDTDTNVFADSQSLTVGATDTITLELTLTPGANLGPYNNTAVASGTSPGGADASDESDNGSNTSGDNGEGTDNDATPVTFTEAPAIGIAKALVAEPTNNSDGTYSLSYQLKVENIGDVSLSNVQVVEDLRTTFPAPAIFVINSISATSLTVNGNFDGDTDTNVFADSQSLAVGATDTITLELTLTPGANLGPYNNTAVASGTSPGGADASDESDNGSNTSGDNGEGTDNDATPVTFSEAPAIGLAKTISGDIGPTVNGSVGNFDVPFSLVLENIGDVPLSDLQLIDDLKTQFGDAYVGISEAAEIITSTATEIPMLSDDFPKNLFNGSTGLLMPGQVININFTLELDPSADDAKGSLTNQAKALGTSPGSQVVDDLSDSGTNASDNADTGGDNPGAPGNSVGGTDDPTPFELPSGGLKGVVWLDANSDDELNDGEVLLIGWTVQVTDINGVVIATLLIDENGLFLVENLPQGEYTVEFITPSGTTYARETVYVPANQFIDIPVPVDPNGVVYDSITRIPVANSLVSIVDNNGMPLPDICLLPNQQHQITGDDGYYFFLLFLGADPACPSDGTFTLEVTAPEEQYQPSHSLLILPQTGAVDPTGQPDPFALSNLSTAPQIGESTRYYMEFTIANGDPDIINNHIPVDQIGVNPHMIRLTKLANSKQTLIGGLVRYTVQVENISDVDVTNLTLIDRLPAGFTYVKNSAYTNDADGALQLTSNQPLTVNGIDVPAQSSVDFVYILRVGAGVARGKHINRVSPYLGDTPIGNEATASIIVGADPDFEEVTILGKVFDDRDSDNWQDSANASGLFIQGGLNEQSYIANSTVIIDNKGERTETDASSPLNHGIALGNLSGRSSEADKSANHQIIIRQKMRELAFTDNLLLTTAEGTRISMSSAGDVSVTYQSDKEQGLTAQNITIDRRVTLLANDNYQIDYVIQNRGIQEIGIPGVRVATVEGLYVETDLYGRFHLEAVDVANLARGRNFYMKVDKATLPPGSLFTSENPRVKRITQGLPTRFDFAVQLAKQQLGGEEKHALIKVGEILFTNGSSTINEAHQSSLNQMANTINQYQGGSVQIVGQAHEQALAYQRANNTYQALLPLIREDLRQAFSVDLVEEVDDAFVPVVNISTMTQLGKVLFDTDESTLKAQYAPLLDSIAEQLTISTTGHLAITGFADSRGTDEYNLALGLRRAKEVFTALKERLPIEVWNNLTIKIDEIDKKNKTKGTK